MKILLTGAQGQLGLALQKSLAPLGQVQALGRGQLDLADLDAVRLCLQQSKPQVIVNAGAYTAVDKAEQEPQLAMQINAHAAAVIAEESRRLGALLLHYSTDYVFDGKAAGAYSEDDHCAPLNQYGVSKRAGEQAIEQLAGDHLILRTSWVYSLQGQNFLRSMLRLLREREQLSVVADQFGAPTWTNDLARVSAHLIQCWQTQALSPSGIYHATGTGETSWYGFACAIAQQLTARGESCAQITPISSSQYPTAAQRPSNSRLSNAKLQSDYGLKLMHWQDALHHCLTALEPA